MSFLSKHKLCQIGKAWYYHRYFDDILGFKIILRACLWIR